MIHSHSEILAQDAYVSWEDYHVDTWEKILKEAALHPEDYEVRISYEIQPYSPHGWMIKRPGLA
jgi:hypothetical protein